MYDWNDVAIRTEAVYTQVLSKVLERPMLRDQIEEFVLPPSLLLMLRSCWRVFSTPCALFFSVVTLAESLWLRLVERLMPSEEVQRALNFPQSPFSDARMSG